MVTEPKPTGSGGGATLDPVITVRLKSEFGVTARVFIDEETGQCTSDDPSDELAAVLERANARAAGPPLWAGPLEVIRQWADETNVSLRHDGELPSEPDRVY